MNIKAFLKFGILMSSVSIFTACTTPRILSHDIDGLCLITQQDTQLTSKTFNELNTKFMLGTPNGKLAPYIIGYQEIAIIPKLTRLSVHRVYEAYNPTGSYRPDIVVKIDQGPYKGTIASIPPVAESLYDPVTGKNTHNKGQPWFYGRKKVSVAGKAFARSDVNYIEYNAQYLKKCN